MNEIQLKINRKQIQHCWKSSGLLDVNLDIDLTPTEIEQINYNFEDNFDVKIHISETSKKLENPEKSPSEKTTKINRFIQKNIEIHFFAL